MKKNVKNGQFFPCALGNVVFNTEDGFSEWGLNINGDVEITEQALLIKAVPFPQGKWISYARLSEFLESAIEALMEKYHAKELEDETARIFPEEEALICCHVCQAMYLMNGDSLEESKQKTIDYMSNSLMSLTPKDVKEVLESNARAI